MKNNRIHFDFAFYLLLFFTLELFFLYKSSHKENYPHVVRIAPSIESFDSIRAAEAGMAPLTKETSVNPLEQRLIDSGLVNVKWIDPGIQVDLKYSTTDNFLGVDIYGDFDGAFLQKDVAMMLAKAQEHLQKQYPFYSLIIYDAVRPRSIQRRMWDTLKLPPGEKTKYLSNPRLGSLHNYGAAVDVSIVNEQGIALDMGTPYDYFGELAHPEKEEQLITEGKLTQHQTSNRKLLREVMQSAGFFNIQTEWWHFNACTRSEAEKWYKIVE